MDNANRHNEWPMSCMRNITSQFGEDGIIETVLKLIGDGSKWCVEFGAWDGKLYSNTWNLINNYGWCGVLIEGDRKRYRELLARYSDNPRIICVNRFIQFQGLDSIDNILGRTPIPKSFDLLSIDIDGNDYYIWDSMSAYNPRVVVIEYNPSIPDDIEFIQPKDFKVNQGSSILSLTKLAQQKGYELIAATDGNLIFVLQEYFTLLGISDNSVPAIRKGHEYETRLFQLFDGTLVLEGCNKLIWHEIPIQREDIQVLPKSLRVYPDAKPKTSNRSALLRILELIDKQIRKRIY